jgi:hypothetical protein
MEWLGRPAIIHRWPKYGGLDSIMQQGEDA